MHVICIKDEELEFLKRFVYGIYTFINVHEIWILWGDACDLHRRRMGFSQIIIVYAIYTTLMYKLVTNHAGSWRCFVVWYCMDGHMVDIGCSLWDSSQGGDCYNICLES